MNKLRYRVRKSSNGLWEVEWKKGILTTLATFASFKAAQEYVRGQIYGGQDAYGMAC